MPLDCALVMTSIMGVELVVVLALPAPITNKSAPLIKQFDKLELSQAARALGFCEVPPLIVAFGICL
jgi:hypothetical protein